MPLEGLPAEKRPAELLEKMELSDPKRAQTALLIAISDCVEMTNDLNADELRIVDDDLRTRGLITLSEIWFKYSKSYQKIVRRGIIRTLREYYLVKGAFDSSVATDQAADRDLVGKMLRSYEATVGEHSKGKRLR